MVAWSKHSCSVVMYAISADARPVHHSGASFQRRADRRRLLAYGCEASFAGGGKRSWADVLIEDLRSPTVLFSPKALLELFVGAFATSAVQLVKLKCIRVELLLRVTVSCRKGVASALSSSWNTTSLESTISIALSSHSLYEFWCVE